MKHKLKSVPSKPHEEATVESFQKDPKFAAEYLNTVLEDGDQEEIMVALRYIAAAYVPQRVTFDPGLGPIQIIAEDGRPYSSAVTLAAGSSVLMTAAERYEFLFTPTTSGIFPINVEFYNYRAANGQLAPIGSIGSVVNVA